MKGVREYPGIIEILKKDLKTFPEFWKGFLGIHRKMFLSCVLSVKLECIYS